MTSIFGGSQTVPTTQAQNTSQNYTQTQNQEGTQSYGANPVAQQLGLGAASWAQNILNRAGAPLYSTQTGDLVGGPAKTSIPLLQVAGLTPEQQVGISNLTNTGYGAGNALIPAAQQSLLGAGQPISAADVEGFYNPMAANITANLQNIFDQQNLSGRIGATSATGGVGGDRAAVAQALLAKQQGLSAGQTYAGLYQSALQAAQQQKAQQLQAGQAALQGGFGALGQGLQAAAIPQAQQQAINQALYQQRLGSYQDPYMRLAALSGAIAPIAGLGGTGVTSQNVGTTGAQTGFGTGQQQTTYPAPPILPQIAGLGSLALGAGMLFSDKRAKTDIQKVGKDKGSGLPMYAYRYKGDPKTYPKVVGPMAQDVKKKFPGAVKELARGGGIPRFQDGGYDDSGGQQQQQQDTNYYDDYTDTGGGQPGGGQTAPYQGEGATWDPKRIFSPDRVQKAQRAIALAQRATQQSQVARPRVAPLTFPQVPWKSGITFARGGRLAINMPMLNRAIARRQEGGSLGGIPYPYPNPWQPMQVVSGEADYEDASAPAGRVGAVPPPWGPKTNPPTPFNFLPAGMSSYRPATVASEVGMDDGTTRAPFSYPARQYIPPNQPSPDARSRADFTPAFRPPSQGNYAQALTAQTLRAQQPKQEGGRVDQSTADEWQGMPFSIDRSPGLGGRTTPIQRLRPHGRFPISGDPRDVLRANQSPLMAAPGAERGVYRFGGKIQGYQDGGFADPLEGLDEIESDEVTGSPAGLPEGDITPLPPPRPAAANAGLPFMPGGPSPDGGGGIPPAGGGAPAMFGKPISPAAMALIQGGLGMLAASGQRDSRGLPMSGLGAIGAGGMAGVNTYQSMQNQQNKDLLAQQGMALRQRAQADLERHRRVLEADQRGRPVKMQDPITGRQYIVDPSTGKEIGGEETPPPSGMPQAPPATTLPSGPEAKTEGQVAGFEAQSGKFTQDEETELPTQPWQNPKALEGVSQEDANLVKAIADGRAKPLSLTRNNFRNSRIMGLVRLYDPKFDETAYARRQRTENEFAVGARYGNNIVAMNTLAQHMQKYKELIGVLDSGQYQDWNKMRNELARRGYLFKDKQDLLSEIDTVQKGIADEAAKVFAGGGQAALEDRRTWAERFDPSKPRSALERSLSGLTDMVVKGRLGALASQYNQGTRSSHQPMDFLTPETRKIYEDMKKGQPFEPEQEKSGASGFTGRTATGPNGQKLRETTDGKWVP